ncbi:DUF6443 domain-containing protein [Pontimicrobium sp. SW4]|uniref:DUF6443 domain-containing protein n=1 Tax=Pontimicrobium sp. SW4 TaxID=3153519 RepID=A0AAU7BRH4_9FLAO
MKHIFNKHIQSLILVCLLSWIGGTKDLQAQTTIYGPSTANVNDVDNYSVNINDMILFYMWSVNGGSKSNMQEQSVTVTWVTASSSNTVEYDAEGDWDAYYGSKTVNVSASAPPATPPMPTKTNNCGNTVLTRTSPPSGETYYWQSTSSGTSISNSAVSVTRTTGTVYYLRSKKGSQWSTARTVFYTINQPTTTYYADFDGDGKGDPNDSILGCSQPTGYVTNSSDLCPNDHGGTNSNGCSTAESLSDENYILSIAPQVAVTGISQITQDKDIIKGVTYFDGLGRAMQSVAIKQSGTSKDIITHMEYNALGQLEKEYLPYVPTTSGSEGLYRTNTLTSINSFYNTTKYDNTTNPYSQKTFEASPLNRVLSQAAPGADWAKGGGHEIEFDYDSNTATDVRKYTVSTVLANNTYTPTLNGGTSYYAAGKLFKTITYDENHDGTSSKLHTTEEFKDKQGRVLLKRTYGESDLNRDGDVLDTGESEAKHDTYYVYDNFGNLTYVLPPLSDANTNIPSGTELNDLCYQYKYDYRNRLIEKKIPGKGWEFIVYDKLDRPVMTQDAVQQPNKEWLVTKYDKLGRVAYTGLYTHSSTVSAQHTMQSHFNTQNNLATKLYEERKGSTVDYDDSYYSNNNFPSSGLELLTINYYDDYSFDLAGSAQPGSITHAYSVSLTTNVKSLATGSKVKVLDVSPDKWISSVMYYDDKARPVYTYSKNAYLNTTDIVQSDLDFVGKALEVKTTHKKTGESDLVTMETFTYDHAGRVTKQTHKINSGAEEVIAENIYDELGQLTTKEVGNTVSNPLQTVNYTYNVRGWLKQINNPASLGTDLFGFKINYNTIDYHTSNDKKLYNGNISEVEWKTANTDSNLKWYKYDYDALNRLTSATSISSNYHLDKVVYDLNGNITKLKRQGHIVANPVATNSSHFNTMDDLVYTYNTNSNQLKKVLDNGNDTYGFKDGSDTTTEYTYDANGNMLTDANKGISSNISYNHLNLPTLVTLPSGNISYIYDATGVKLKKTVSTGATTKYAGNYIYEDSGSGDVLKFFNHPEGYVEPDGSNWDYVYQYKDHLGNIRLSYKNTGTTSSPTLQIQEENNYYPFGLKHKGYNNNPISENKYHTYNGKELEEALGLNWLEYGARNYDAAIGRFFNIDRYSESFMPISTYQYAANNPVSYIDYNGDYITLGINDEEGNEYSVLYENGKAYHYSKDEDGNIVKGGEYDGDASFVDQAVSDLGKIGNTKQGNTILGKLQRSSTRYNISNSGDALTNSYDHENNEISYSPLKVGLRDGVFFNESHIKLGHELAHAYDDQRGFNMNSTTLGGLPASEINAVRFENYLRALNGESTMRTKYTYPNRKEPYSLRSSLGGTTANFFKRFIAPSSLTLNNNQISPEKKLIKIDNTRVSIPKVVDTNKQKFISDN